MPAALEIAVVRVRCTDDTLRALQVRVLQADGEVYAALVDGKLAVKLGSSTWTPPGAGVQPAGIGQEWVPVTSGIDYAVCVEPFYCPIPLASS